MVCVNKNITKSERKCAISVSDLRVRQNKFEKNTECKGEKLFFWDCIGIKYDVCIILSIIYNLLPPWTYLIWGTM